MQTENLYLHDKKAYRAVETDLFKGYQLVELPELKKEDITLTWKGAPIGEDVWAKAVAFLLWSQKEHDSEGFLYLFYNSNEHRWDCWACPQHSRGMTVDTRPQDPAFTLQRKQWGKGWRQMGTIHHHCKTTAFQSSTDEIDEATRDGIHITLGRMDKDDLDYHARLLFSEIEYTVDPFTWFELPEWLLAVPEKYLHKDTALRWLCDATRFADVTFPEVWKDNFSVPIATPGYYGQGYHPGQGTALGAGANSKKNEAAPHALPYKPGSTTATTINEIHGKLYLQRLKFELGGDWASAILHWSREVIQISTPLGARIEAAVKLTAEVHRIDPLDLRIYLMRWSTKLLAQSK